MLEKTCVLTETTQVIGKLHSFLGSPGQVWRWYLQDVRFIIVIVQHSIQALVPQVELTEWGQAAKAASPRAAPVQVAEGLQAHRTLLRGDAGILLPFSSPVRHRLEAAGAYGMASLKRAHVIRGCCWQAGRCWRCLPTKGQCSSQLTLWDWARKRLHRLPSVFRTLSADNVWLTDIWGFTVDIRQL